MQWTFRPIKEAGNNIFGEGLRIFNELPNEIKSEKEFIKFKRLLSENIRTKYKIN